MAGDLDSEFLRRLSLIENELPTLNASSLDDFRDRWTTLVDDLIPATESLRDTTVTFAHALAVKVSSVVQSLLDLELLAQRLLSTFLDEHSATTDTPPQSETFGLSFPTYIKASCEWLVNNIHNPYPSNMVRDDITSKSASARKDVDNWFIDARKRIGWNDARKAFFSNKRVDIVNAATRFFANDEKLCLSQDAEHALITIMKNAKNLYADKFDETTLASKLASAVKDLTPETKAEAERLRQLHPRHDRDVYPSPEHSPEPTRLSPVPSDEEYDNAVSTPIAVIGRKRPTEPFDTEENGDSRFVKRARLDTATGTTVFPTGLLSPTPSVDEPLQVAESSETSSTPTNLSIPPDCKRRLSESDEPSAPKRPRHLPPGPRLQPASDPLLLSNELLYDDSSFDGWFQQTFDPPEVGQTSPSGFSVELGNLSDFDCEIPAESQPAIPVASEQPFESPTPEVVDVPPASESDMLWKEFGFVLPENVSIPSMADSVINFAASHEPLPPSLAHALSTFDMSSQGLQTSNDYHHIFGQPIGIPLNTSSDDAWGLSSSLATQNNVCDFGKHSTFESSFPQSFDFVSPAEIYLPPVPQDKEVDHVNHMEEKLREAYATINKLQEEIQQSRLHPSEVAAL